MRFTVVATLGCLCALVSACEGLALYNLDAALALAVPAVVTYLLRLAAQCLYLKLAIALNLMNFHELGL